MRGRRRMTTTRMARRARRTRGSPHRRRVRQLFSNHALAPTRQSPQRWCPAAQQWAPLLPPFQMGCMQSSTRHECCTDWYCNHVATALVRGGQRQRPLTLGRTGSPPHLHPSSATPPHSPPHPLLGRLPARLPPCRHQVRTWTPHDTVRPASTTLYPHTCATPAAGRGCV